MSALYHTAGKTGAIGFDKPMSLESACYRTAFDSIEGPLA